MWNTLKRMAEWLDQIMNPITMEQLTLNALADTETLRAQLAQAEIELADKAFYVREFAAVSMERDGLKAQLSAPPVGDHPHSDADAIAARAVAELEANGIAGLTTHMAVRRVVAITMEATKAERAELRERAAVPVPAGVPEIKALREIGINAYLMHEQAKRENAGCIVGPMEAAATAIRDAVLAGAGQNTAPSADEVDALARVLRDAHAKHYNLDPESVWLEGFRCEARAAIAHIRKRPEGLPTPDQFNAHFARIDRGLFEHDVIELIYDYLAPYLRDPVGWELDVTAREVEHIAWEGRIGERAPAILDLCRSRIRPVMECKECAAWKAKYNELNQEINKALEAFGTAMPALNAARAALEGE